MFKIIFVAVVLVAVATGYYQTGRSYGRQRQQFRAPAIVGRQAPVAVAAAGQVKTYSSAAAGAGQSYGGGGDGGYGGGQEQYHAPEPYNFAYDVTDEYGTRLHRTEDGDASGTVRGSYGYQDANGIYRIVDYVADANGFRANIRTNEPGTKTSNPADAQYNVVNN